MDSSVFALTDKVAIVTGGGRGIGKTIAIEFAKAGAHVVIAGRTLSVLEETAAEIRKLGRRSLVVVTDVSKPEDAENMAKRTVDEFGKIDILVNNAANPSTGTDIRRPLIEDMTPEDWDTGFAVDMKGTFLCSKAVGPAMKAQKKGKIINMTSMFGVDRFPPAHTAYGSAKAGVVLFTKLLAVEWAKYNINVNCIGPSCILTEAAKDALEKMGKLEHIVKISCALQRAGRTEDIAYGAIYLASDAADYVNGILLPIDGGPVPFW